MASARTVGTIEASASEVWGYVGNFAGIDQFMPPIARSVGTGDGVGMQRQCTFQDGAQITKVDGRLFSRMWTPTTKTLSRANAAGAR